MPRLTQEQSLKLLQDAKAIVDGLHVVDDATVFRAIRVGKGAIERVFGPDSDHMRDLTSELSNVIANSSKMNVVRGMLNSALDVITLFWDAERAEPEETPQGNASSSDSRVVFVIHGRQKRSDMHAFLRAIGLTPLEWGQARK